MASRQRFVAGAFALVALLGFMDSTFLAVEYLFGNVPPCTVVAGCEVVTRSTYASLGGMPVSVLGAAYYLAMFFTALLFIYRGEVLLLRLASWATALGVLASLYFTYLQLFVIDAICLYCLLSAVTSSALFILGFSLRRSLPRPT